jgi:hypothetical protein
MKTRTTILLAAICAIPAAAAALALAEGPATRPSDTSRPAANYPLKGERRFGPFGGGAGGIGAALRGEKGFQPTEGEMQAAEQFLKDELPTRYELFAQLPQASPMRQRVLEFMTIKYRVLLRVKDQDPEMYEQLLKEAKLEDEAMKLALDVRHGDASAESKLHEKARELVDLSLQNRQARIDRLEQQLSNQKEQLARDMERRDEKIDEKANALRKDFNRLFDGMERRRGKEGSQPPAATPASPTGEKQNNPQ